MRTVYKYAITGMGYTMPMPQGAEILTAAFQGDDLQLWAKVDTEAPDRPRTFAVYGTGHDIPQQRMEYIATAFLGVLVFHVFEILP